LSHCPLPNLFDRLPATIFSPLASKNRRFHAALLMHLATNTFATPGHTPRKGEVIAEIADFIDTFSRFETYEDEEPPAPPGQDIRHYEAYRRLHESGWLLEIRDRYRRLVDLTPEGRLLLRDLTRIATGDSRAYGAAVLRVYDSLETAYRDPENRAQSLRNAADHAAEFDTHLRTITASMVRIEQELVETQTFGALMSAFFDQFVEKHLISDYATLFTENNPFRFQGRIREIGTQMRTDYITVHRLATSYVREGLAVDEAAAQQQIHAQLEGVLATFSKVELALDRIEDTRLRIERRVRTAISYMDRVNDTAIEDMVTTIRRLAGLGGGQEELNVEARLLNTSHLLAPDALRVKEPACRVIGRSRMQPRENDPAVEAFIRAKREYALRVAPTRQRMEAFLDRIVGDRDGISSSEIAAALVDVDDFVLYQRLRELPALFGGHFAQEWEIRFPGGAAHSEWLEHPEFTLRRKAGRKEPAA